MKEWEQNMNRNIFLFTLVSLLIVACSGNPRYQDSDSNQSLATALTITPQPIDNINYRLGSGDRIYIKVFDQDELSLEVLVGDSGTINYSYLNTIQIAGLTVSEVEKTIISGLKGDYLKDPNVQVSVVEYRPFFIDGEVNSPGGYPYQPGLTVRKAIALAGGFSERASKNKIFIIRATDTKQEKIKVSLDAPAYPGDILTINESFF